MTAHRLILVNPPFAAVHYPSIQLGIIQAYAERASVQTQTIYANLMLHKLIESRLYNLISDHRGFQVGDWLFSRAAFQDEAPDGFIEQNWDGLRLLIEEAGVKVSYLEHLRESVLPEFIDEFSEFVVSRAPEVVGITSTFEQTVAGLAIARGVKRRDNRIKTVFGGANFDDTMGEAHFAAFDFIDVVLSGEFEPAAASLFSALGLTQGQVQSTPAMHSRLSAPSSTVPGAPAGGGHAAVYSAPDYSDYFTQLREVGIERNDMKAPLVVPFESSRGCWWGEKHHCTFCGLNGSTMKFRQRRAADVVEELSAQERRFGATRFAAVDNIIGPQFFREFSDILESAETSWSIFYEVKANLTIEQIRDFSRAGVWSIQPGIESLSTPVLKLMRKGIRAIQNVNTMKWCHYFRVQCSWNLLYGFPGETTEHYAEQLLTLKSISHLPPPAGGGRIWLERFSPYFTGQAEGFHSVRYERSLDCVYPARIDKQAISYFFSGEGACTISDDDYSTTASWLREWRELWKREVRPYLYYSGSPGEIKIADGRADPWTPRVLRYKEPVGTILRFCGDRPRSVESVLEFLRQRYDAKFSLEEVGNVMNGLVERGLMMTESGAYLFLALPLSEHRRIGASDRRVDKERSSDARKSERPRPEEGRAHASFPLESGGL
ncbi:RiPP maturation radical SAM C-methyltransferase [Roseitranquillus sediminis]|uniref:RiPP maturation radical SAM C-methyltransferase n=1 Tax=Roseitranquillus sediminis TaxID=2809051 RepID=UPI001D0C76A0|nr:RiPP maturation radical SAM C-methyltransferase [Roseitranquillus sediminis]MBM9593435.1 RiPP maturation radical SAM C-methyltransferase [Roseitranquillus sediminis]